MVNDIENSTEISYIYGLYSTKDNKIRYIGYSSSPKKRLRSHLLESNKLKYRRHKWIQSELKSGFNINLKVLKCCPTINVSQVEIDTIKHYRKISDVELVNGNDGGIGGVNPTPEIRERLRITKLGNKWNIGKVKSKETREKLSKALKGKTRSRESIEKCRLARLGKPNKNRKYSEEDIVNLFNLFNSGKHSIEQLGILLNINYKTIASILYNKVYQDIKNKHNLKIIIKRENGIIKWNRERIVNKTKQ